MLYLNSGTTSTVTVTLYEKCNNLYNPFFTWLIKDTDTRQEYVFTNTDISPAPWYYNQFSFTVTAGATQGATAGVIPAFSGEFYYRVYEMANQYDLNISNAVKEVESGILIIQGTTSTVPVFVKEENTVAVFKKIINN